MIILIFFFRMVTLFFLLTHTLQPHVSEQVTVNLRKMGLSEVPNSIPLNVTTLILDGNAIRRLEANSLGQLNHLENLKINYNALTYIDNLAFTNNTNLSALHMAGHNLSTFPSELGGASDWIEVIKMGNSKQNLTQAELNRFVKLISLVMSSNLISNGELVLHELPNLQYITAKRCQLTVFPILSAAPSLRVVQLNDNDFEEIPQSTIQGLDMLRILALAHCNINRLPDLSHLVSLQQLLVNGNNLATLPDVYQLPLTTIYWASNPLKCNQNLCWIRMWEFMKPVLNTDVIANADLSCAAPPKLIGHHWSNIHPVDLECFRGKHLYESWYA